MSDLIERQAAIDTTWEDPSYTDPLNVLSEVRDRIKALPSAQPEIIRCKDCKFCIKNLVNKSQGLVNVLVNERESMGDLISRRALLAEYDRLHVGEPGRARKMIEDAPSVQSEIIRCKDCRYGVHAGCGNTYLCVVSPEDRLEHKCDFWCVYAERRKQ